jgi:ribosome biogenesis GTPase A
MKKNAETVLHREKRMDISKQEISTNIYYEYYRILRKRHLYNILMAFANSRQNMRKYYFIFIGKAIRWFLFDYRGHGRSERRINDPEKSICGFFEEYLFDLEDYI